MVVTVEIGFHGNLVYWVIWLVEMMVRAAGPLSWIELKRIRAVSPLSWIELKKIRAAGPLNGIMYGMFWNGNDEGWALICTTGHSGPSGICMVWDVRGLFDQAYELTKGKEKNLNLCISCMIIYFNFIYEFVHACCLKFGICGLNS